MRFTLTQGAQEAGVSKGTISKALKAGRMSAERMPDGSFQIEPVELFRVFPPKPPEPRVATVAKHDGNTGEQSGNLELAVLRERLAGVENQLERERADREHDRTTIEDLRRRLDQETEERRSLQRQLTPPIPAAAPEAAQERPVMVVAGTVPERARKGFVARLLGR